MTGPILFDGTINNYVAVGGLFWGIALLLALVAGIGYAIERARTACRLIEQIIDEEAPRLRDDEDVEALVRGLDDSLLDSQGPDLPEAGHDIDTLRRLVAEDRAHLRVVDQMDPRWLRRRLAAQEPRPCPPWCSCHVDTTPDGAA